MSLSSLDRALALRGAPLFAGLSAEALIPVAALCTEVRLGPDDTLFRAGELGDAMYVVVDGSVRVVVGTEVITLLGRGECVGEMAALDWEPRSATVVADGPALLVRLGRNELMDLLRDHPELVRSLALVLANRIRAM
ncbi:MAG: cyclic nucleotide-binding domain-containing protein [Kofleriaceae bacterium]